MSKDFNWKQYKTDVVKKYVKKYGSKNKAIVELDAQIDSLKLKTDTLSEMVDGVTNFSSGKIWEQIEKEYESTDSV